MSEAVQGNATRSQQTGDKARAEASATAGTAKQAAGQVAGTAAEQARAVAGEAQHQVGVVAHDLRSRARDEADTQAKRAAGTLRHWADDLAGMAAKADGDSPARALASQAADRGHRAADYLERQGIDGVMSEVQGFARRHPGMFLGGMLATGLAVGHLGKVASKADQPSEDGQRASFETPDQARPYGQESAGRPAAARGTAPGMTAPGATQGVPPSIGTPPRRDTPGRPYPEV